MNFPKIKFKESDLDVCGEHVLISRFFSQDETCEQTFSEGKRTNGTPKSYCFCFLHLLFFAVRIIFLCHRLLLIWSLEESTMSTATPQIKNLDDNLISVLAALCTILPFSICLR